MKYINMYVVIGISYICMSLFLYVDIYVCINRFYMKFETLKICLTTNITYSLSLPRLNQKIYKELSNFQITCSINCSPFTRKLYVSSKKFFFGDK